MRYHGLFINRLWDVALGRGNSSHTEVIIPTKRNCNILHVFTQKDLMQNATQTPKKNFDFDRFLTTVSFSPFKKPPFKIQLIVTKFCQLFHPLLYGEKLDLKVFNT